MEVAPVRPGSNRALKREPRSQGRESSADSDDATPPTMLHTITACCRCRQRKTRCDPTLPKCLSCERSGQICEYWDPAKKQRVPRHYVLRLMDQVRSLEAELNRFIEEDGPPQDAESLIRPGGIIRLHENDDAPRYLGPSSGVAITRLVMEEAKRYADTKKIRDLVPEVRGRNPPRGLLGMENRKQSYPMISAVPAKTLPSRQIADNLTRVFNEKAQVLWPTIHEPSFATDLEDVYNGSQDIYKNFIVRIVLAISLQKADMQYSGLADSFYLAAIENLEEVVKLKDLRTVQCLVLIAQYSLLTPTRTAIYYIVGFATRLCQQLGLTEEGTIGGGKGLQVYNPLEVDMRRRLHWIVLSMEFGLAQILGRPNAFAASKEHIDVEFFELVADENITAHGITPEPKSINKAVAVHFFKMRFIQSEIRKVLYQNKRDTPKDAQDPWFTSIQADMDEWHHSCPSDAKTIGPWFTDRYNTMVVFLNRPSPQISEPSARQALICYDASANILQLQEQGIEEVTWVFVATTHMVLNTFLWSLSYSEVRNAHPREEAERNIESGISVLAKSRERWPSHAAATDHYSRLSKAILRSYDMEPLVSNPSSLSATSPASALDTNSPNSDNSSTTTGSAKYSNTNDSSYTHSRPKFTDNVFGLSRSEPVLPQRSLDYGGQPNAPHQDRGPPRHPSFRSGSIFANPGSMQNDRRASYFPPEAPQQQLPNWSQINAPPEPPQESLGQQPMNHVQQNLQAQPMRPGQRTIPAHLMPRDIQPFLANSMTRNLNSFPPDTLAQDQKPQMIHSMPPGQHPLPPASSNFLHMDPSITDPLQFLQGPAHLSNWDPLGNPFTEDYEMHDRMGSLSQEQQAELMEYLEVDGLDFVHNMNLDSGLAQWEMQDMGMS